MCAGDVSGDRRYTRAELEAVASAAVREAVEEAESERVAQLARRVLREFDERRGSALGFSAEQLSGTRRVVDLPDCGHGHVHPRPDGARARCGGPAICWQCANDAAAVAVARGEAV